MVADDPRVAEAKGKGMIRIMDLLQIDNLKRAGRELVGPCPKCFGDDRFSVNVQKGMFHCRGCGGAGDEIRLVEFVLGLDFKAALDWLCGPQQYVSPEELQRRQVEYERKEKAKAAAEAKYRADALADAREKWDAGRAAEDSPVRDYLHLRGITRALLPVLPRCLRFHPNLPYMVRGGRRGDWVEAHRGPAMLAAVQGADDRFHAVHRTWFDLSAPQGKVAITHPLTGEAMSRKKSLGSVKGCAIRLVRGTGTTLIMGEGIETTFTAHLPQVYPDAHFWAGIDMGNMAGRRATGQGLKFAGLPDLGDVEAFVPPAWVTRLIFVQDGDSDPQLTRAKMLAGLRRAKLLRPGLVAQLAPCPPGRDLNDVLLEGVED